VKVCRVIQRTKYQRPANQAKRSYESGFMFGFCRYDTCALCADPQCLSPKIEKWDSGWNQSCVNVVLVLTYCIRSSVDQGLDVLVVFAECGKRRRGIHGLAHTSSKKTQLGQVTQCRCVWRWSWWAGKAARVAAERGIK